MSIINFPLQLVSSVTKNVTDTRGRFDKCTLVAIIVTALQQADPLLTDEVSCGFDLNTICQANCYADMYNVRYVEAL